MTPILYNPNETNFDTLGLGMLSDCISCEVRTVLNGQFELVMQYPITGARYDDLKLSCMIKAVSEYNGTPQLFDIYQITKPLNGIISIYALHVTGRKQFIPVMPCSASSISEAFTAIKANSAEENPFIFLTDKVTKANFKLTTPVTLGQALGGMEGSILDTYRGEYEFDNFNIKLWNHRGHDNGVALRYGKNITNFEQEETIASTVTGVCPFWSDSDGNIVTLPEKVIESDRIENFPYNRTVVIDFSERFENPPTVAQLRAITNNYITVNDIGIPKVSMSLSFEQLAQYPEYEDIESLETVSLGDTVTVYFEPYNVATSARIVETVYNTLLNKYTSIRIGSVKANLAQSLNALSSEVEKLPQTISSGIAEKVRNILESSTDGTIYFNYDDDGKMNELYILDTDSPETATRMWRWNMGGWGYSNDGGKTYTVAATMDGAIVADFIKTGTLDADLVTVKNIKAENVLIQNGETVSYALSNMQDQIDGNVETFVGASIPTLTNYPANAWKASEYAKHIGDIYYVANPDSDEDGYAYRFAKEENTNTYKWTLIKDSDVTKAVKEAKDALDAANEAAGVAEETSNLLVTNYYTKAQTDTKFSVSEQEILSSVSETYTTRVDFAKAWTTNLVKFPYAAGGSISGVTYKYDNETFVITANGKASGNASIYVFDTFESGELPSGTYTLSGGNLMDSNLGAELLVIINRDGTPEYHRADGGQVTFDYDNNTSFSLAVQVAKDFTVTNWSARPMLERGSVAHDYVPYDQSMDIMVERVKSAESSIKQNSDNIELKVSTSDYNGEKVASLINQSPNTIKIAAQHIELTGDNIADRLNSAETTVQISANKINLSAYSTTEQVNSLISQSGNGILTQVSQTYATKDGLSTAEGKITAAEGRLTTAEGKISDNESEISATNEKLATAEGKISANESKIAAAESKIEQNATNIESKVSITDYNGNTIASKINQSAADVIIEASHINLSAYSTTSQINSLIDQSSSSILTQVSANYASKSDLANLEAGGTNYLKNSGTFINWNKSANVTINTLDLDGRSIAYFPTNTSQAWRYINNYNNNSVYLRYGTAKGRQMTLSMYVKSADYADLNNVYPTQKLAVALGLRTSSSATRTKYKLWNIPSEKVKAGWTRVFFTFTVTDSLFNAGSGTISDSDYLSIDLYNYSLYSCEFTKPQLEFGNLATQWSPSPNDYESRLASAESSISQNASNIALKVSATDYTGEKIASLINQSASTVTIQAAHINLNGAVSANSNVTISTDGKITAKNATISGAITASSGTLGGFYITTTAKNDTSANSGHCYASSLYTQSGDGTYEYETGIHGSGKSQTANSGNIAFYVKRITKGGTWATNSTNMFYVTNAGKLYCTNAEITGKITATSGTIGGFTVDSTHLNCSRVSSDGNTYFASMQAPSSLEDGNTNRLAFGVGKTASGTTTYPFIVRYSGALTATNATITGKITASSGQIGCWGINSDMLIGTYTKDSTHYYETILEGGKYGAKNAAGDILVVKLKASSTATSESYPFALQADGTVYCQKLYVNASGNALYTTYGNLCTAGALYNSSKSQSISNNTTTAILSVALPVGRYIAIGKAYFNANATGQRQISFGTNKAKIADNSLEFCDYKQAVSGTYTICNVFSAWSTGAATYYLNVYQNSGAALTCTAALNIIKIA